MASRIHTLELTWFDTLIVDILWKFIVLLVLDLQGDIDPLFWLAVEWINFSCTIVLIIVSGHFLVCV